ncbi:MAG: IS1 family transposase [Colwellia sp.]|nr:IS1 family transposase [Colwellia sp.]
MELKKIYCPNCKSQAIKNYSQYGTKNNGCRTLYECCCCATFFSETKNTFMEGLRKPISLIVMVVKAKTEGMAFNAACRVFDIAKNTLLLWERRLSGLKKTLFLFILTHEFLKLVIEGDELYTKVNKNVPPDESSGWTIVLMDRASRFILEMKCGKKDSRLFKKVIKRLSAIIERTNDITLLTDGERRYGNLLFEICHELIRNGKAGRPKKTLKRGVKVRIKNKGSQSKKRGRKRQKYQSPWPEHPNTSQDIKNQDIHANHTEGQNASIRRKNSTFRRKTNTYAKKDNALQRTLNVQWIVHNFVQVHFTIKKVPAVALGILTKGLSLSEIFMIQKMT